MSDEKIVTDDLNQLICDVLGFIDYQINVYIEKKSELPGSLSALQMIGVLSTNLILNMTACALMENTPSEAKREIMKELLETISTSILSSWEFYCQHVEVRGLN